MFKKVRLGFFTVLILFSILTSCTRNTNTGVPSPALSAFESPINTPDVFPSSTAGVSSSAITLQPAETPTPTQSTSSVSNKNTLITKEVFLHLSSPELNGRTMGSIGSEQTRSVIQGLFSDMKLEPFTDDYSFPVFRDPFRKASSSDIKGDGYNVVGYIKGRDSTESLIISAHYDGSENGAGALDNASGVYGLLKTAELFKNYSSNQAPDRDIIFAVFDGEEDGLIGSGNLANQIKEQYRKAIVINFDCIGIKASDSYMVLGDSGRYNALIEPLYQQLELYDLKTVPVAGNFASDHLSFEWQDIPAVTIGERGVDGIVHTSEDTADKVDTAEIDRLSEAVYAFISEQANSLYEVFYP